MKICRFQSQGGEILHGVYDVNKPDEAAVLQGALFGDHKITQRREGIRTMLAPVIPANIIALGLNYKKHAEETGMSYPELPVMFLKGANSVIGPGETILLPKAGPGEVDYEAELAIIVGKPGKNIPLERAFEHIFGYCCANDVSARDWQIHKQKGQWARGKSFDTFCPLGPWIVTKDEIKNPDDLAIRTILNKKIMQDARTSDLCFGIADIVSDLSRSMTLLPGTVILTGTPSGVGFTRKPPVFLQPRDNVTIEIEQIGRLENPVKLED
ncbi:MAG: fumarylacetoacetate hydrolase family protein [Deltaproteobacteria bacterium]|nr:fumarylacetoacetate hydrolase family protein [Deltaproteobacteria bacterium]